MPTHTHDGEDGSIDEKVAKRGKVVTGVALTLSAAAALLLTVLSSSNRPSHNFKTSRDLSPDDKAVATWQIEQIRKADSKNQYEDVSDQELLLRLINNPDVFAQSKAYYDLAMEAEAERKSGRSFDDFDSPKVPLKWEALTEFQQTAVKHALKTGTGLEPDEHGWDTVLRDFLSDVNNLTDAVNEYRHYQQTGQTRRRADDKPVIRNGMGADGRMDSYIGEEPTSYRETVTEEKSKGGATTQRGK